MKNLTLTLFMIGFSGILSAQSKFGIITYQLPSTWETTAVGNNLVLFNPSNPGCKIGLFSLAPTDIDSENEFWELRTQKMNELGMAQYHYPDPIYLENYEGWTIWSSKTEINSPQSKWSMLVTFSNKIESAGYIYEVTSPSCLEEQEFVFSQMGVEPEPIPSTDSKNTKGKGKPVKDLRKISDPQKGKNKN